MQKMFIDWNSGIPFASRTLSFADCLYTMQVYWETAIAELMSWENKNYSG